MDTVYDFILACARYALDPAQFAAPVFPAGVETHTLIDQAYRHRVVGLVYKAGSSVPGLLPDDCLRQLRSYYYSDLLLSQAYIREVKQVLGKLRAAAVPMIVFKAWAAFPTVYGGNYGERSYADIDLLIPPEQLRPVDDLLLAMGYQPVMEFWPGIRFRHHISGMTYARVVSPKETYVIDLHWGIFSRPYHDDRIDVAGLFERALPLEVVDEPVLQFSVEDLILHTCGHLSLHHQYDEELSRYYELAWWMRHAGRNIDWAALLARCTDWKLAVAMQRFAPELEDRFPNTFSPEFLQALQAVQPAQADVKTHDWLVKYFHTPLSGAVPARWTLTSLWDALGLMLETVFPGPRYLEQRYGTTRFLPQNYWRRWMDLTRRLPGSAPE